MEVKPLQWLWDRSRTLADWKCPRSRYWAYHYGGKGVTNGGIHLELYLGTALHDGLAAIAQTHPNIDIDVITTTAQKQVYQALVAAEGDDPGGDAIDFANEQAALVEGLLRGFHKHVWPTLILGSTIVAVEQEMEYKHNDMVFMSKPDLVIRDGEDNNWYVEYKSTSSKKDNWINSWDTAVQLHSSIKAVEQTLGIKMAGVIVQGLYKGFESYGKQSSPFCYAYARNGQPPFFQSEYSYEYKAGFKRSPTWELPGGVKKWVENMPTDILASQFPTTPPIFIKDHLINRFFDQRAIRELEINQALNAVRDGTVDEQNALDVIFPQHFEQCVPGWGKPCQFRILCHGGGNGNPLDQGFQFRESHHQLEREQLSESSN